MKKRSNPFVPIYCQVNKGTNVDKYAEILHSRNKGGGYTAALFGCRAY